MDFSMSGVVAIEPIIGGLTMGNYGGAVTIPIAEPQVYRVELRANDDGVITDDWALVEVAPWQPGAPSIDDQLRDWAIQYMPDWGIVDACLATEQDLKLFADEEF